MKSWESEMMIINLGELLHGGTFGGHRYVIERDG
jgi:hypothetical protein